MFSKYLVGGILDTVLDTRQKIVNTFWYPSELSVRFHSGGDTSTIFGTWNYI